LSRPKAIYLTLTNEMKTLSPSRWIRFIFVFSYLFGSGLSRLGSYPQTLTTTQCMVARAIITLGG
jgi:hypothetical protein